MIKTPITLQDLRRKIYIKAKADKSWRFWGIYVHVCKLETLRTAYKQAKQNNGSLGIDGLTFEMIEASGLDEFLASIRSELQSKSYFPSRKRIVMIPKNNGHKMRKLSIATIKDRVVEGALKLILEPIFEADFQPGSYGYRPKRKASEAIQAVTIAVLTSKTKVIDVDLSSYFDTISHAELFGKVATRIQDGDVMRLLTLIVKAGGKRGISQGGPLSPLLSNIYLNEVDKMLEKAKKVSTEGDGHAHMAYIRWADDLLILIDGHNNFHWLERAIHLRLRQELMKIKVIVNEEKTKTVDLKQGETFSFLGFDFKNNRTKQGKTMILKTPRMKARTTLLSKLKVIFCKYKSQPVSRVISLINPILRGWTNYFRIGNSSRCFDYIRDWVVNKVRRHLMCARQRQGFGWGRWSRRDLYEKIKLYNDYQIRYQTPSKATTVG